MPLCLTEPLPIQEPSTKFQILPCCFYSYCIHLFLKYLGIFLAGNLLTKICPKMLNGHVGPVEVSFTGPKLFGGIYTGLGPAVH